MPRIESVCTHHWTSEKQLYMGLDRHDMRHSAMSQCAAC